SQQAINCAFEEIFYQQQFDPTDTGLSVSADNWPYYIYIGANAVRILFHYKSYLFKLYLPANKKFLLWECNETQAKEFRAGQINLCDVSYDFVDVVDEMEMHAEEFSFCFLYIYLFENYRLPLIKYFVTIDECPPLPYCDSETSFCG
ncbi:unnamed protein product, partial [Rotaria socialis]